MTEPVVIGDCQLWIADQFGVTRNAVSGMSAKWGDFDRPAFIGCDGGPPGQTQRAG